MALDFSQELANNLAETNLRQALANFEAEGVLSEKNLERGYDDRKGSEVIKGSLVIKTDDYNYVTVNVYVPSKKNDGGDNPAFAGMITVMENYQSLADVGAANATKIRTSNGSLRPNSYIDNQGMERHSIRYNCSFFNTSKSDKYEPHASFDVEMYISALRPEIYTRGEHQGEETGRYIIEGWVPTYNGIEPITLIAPEEDGIAGAISSIYEVGETAKFYGHIVNSQVEQITEIPVAIGRPKIEKSFHTVNELVIDGGSAPYPEEPMGGSPAAYNSQTIQVAVNDKKAKLESQKKTASYNKSSSSSYNAGNNFMNKPAANSGRNLPF